MKRDMNILKTAVAAVAAVAMTGIAAAQVPMARVGDVTRLQGHGTNVLIGYGLVTGLNGTGDGKKFVPTMQALRSMMERFGATIDTLDDVGSSDNTAVVMLEAVIPEHGAREGSLLDVQVSAISAESLMGGRLLPTPLIYHDQSVEGLFAFAQGKITTSEDLQTSGTIRGGARMERDVLMHVIARGSDLLMTGFDNPWIRTDGTYVTLVLDDAHVGWSMAAAIAQAVDKELSLSADVDRVALAVDSQSVIVLLPEHQRGDPASWIRDIERTPILMESNEARVTINRSAGTIVITGDTRMSPVVVSQRGMTVTVANPEIEGTTLQQPLVNQDFVQLDTTAEPAANLRDLIQALNQLKVPFEDRVSIIEQVHRAGKLHARILYEG